jgi:serine protease Do
LFNDRGEVIGIITMKLAGDYEGLGFAIPISAAQPLLNALMTKGSVSGVKSQVSFPRATLGVTGVYLEKDYYYVLTETGVDRLTEDKAAETEGSFKPTVSGVLVTGTSLGTDAVGKFQKYDIITAIDGKTIVSFESMREYLYDCFVGDTVTLTYERAGQEAQVKVTLVYLQ